MIGMELFSLTSVDDDEIDGQTTYKRFPGVGILHKTP